LLLLEPNTKLGLAAGSGLLLLLAPKTKLGLAAVAELDSVSGEVPAPAPRILLVVIFGDRNRPLESIFIPPPMVVVVSAAAAAAAASDSSLDSSFAAFSASRIWHWIIAWAMSWNILSSPLYKLFFFSCSASLTM